MCENFRQTHNSNRAPGFQLMVGTAMRIKFLLTLICAASFTLAAQTTTTSTTTTTTDTPAASSDNAKQDSSKKSDKDKKKDKDKIAERDDKEIPKSGSMKDVSAVGNRNVG